MLAQERWYSGFPLSADGAKVPELERAVQRCGCDQVRVEGVYGETADFLVRQGEELRWAGFGGGTCVVHAEGAIERGEIERIGICGGYLDAGKGLVDVGRGGCVDFG